MSRRSATLTAQPSLFDAEPQPEPPPPPPPPQHRTRRNHALQLPRPWKPAPCTPTCLICQRPEGLGVCPDGQCAIVCGPPNRRGPVEVCVLTHTLPARLIGRHAAIHCPHCDTTHWHQPAPGRTYRIGQCGQPYIVHTLERSST